MRRKRQRGSRRSTTPQPPAAIRNGEQPVDRVTDCLNCGAPAPGKYCPECGQETAREPRTVAQFLDGLTIQYATRQGQLWQTLSKLCFAPGALTVDYIAGKRARYLRPLQLYLIASLIVFGAVQFFGLNLGLRLYGDQGVHLLRSTRLTANDGHGAGMGLTPVQIILDHIDTPAVRHFDAVLRHLFLCESPAGLRTLGALAHRKCATRLFV